MMSMALLAVQPALALEPVTLQLKWTHDFEFAGYYAAVEQGYYRDAGLDVTLREASPADDIVGNVVSGKAQYGVGSSSLLLDRAAGKPVVALAVIFQHSPYIFVARADSPNQTVHDLVGKRFMIEDLAGELKAYLQREGIELDKIQQLHHSFNSQDLIDGKVDAYSAYLTNEPFYYDRIGFNYQVLSPRAAGIDFYGDNLFTSENELKNHPERVKAFREASLRGWQYVMQHRDEMVRLITSKYAKHLDPAHLQFEATVQDGLMNVHEVAIGYMYPGRWEHIADVYAEIGMLPKHFSLEGFLYDPNPQDRSVRFYGLIAVMMAIIAFIAGIAAYIHRVNQRLKKSLSDVRVLTAAIEHGPISMMVTSPERVIQYVNPFFARESGYRAEEVIGKTPKIVSSGLTPPDVYRQLKEALARGEAWEGEFVNRRKNGELYWSESHIAPVRDEYGNTTNYVAVQRDVTQRRQDKEALFRSQLMYRMLTENMKDVIWVLDTATNRYTYVSPSVELMRGYSAEEVMAAPVEQAVVAEHRDDVFSSIAQGLADFRAGRIASDEQFFNEVAQPCKDGSVIWTEVSSYFWRNEETGHIELHGVSRNVTERKKAEEQLRHMAQHDALTGLPNRLLFAENLRQGLALARRSDSCLALMMLDLDGFKPINDTHGHEFGDLVLKEAALRIKDCLRDSDSVGRIGGDEFTVLLNDIGNELNVLMIAEKIREALKQPIHAAGKEFIISASIGVAIYPDHGDEEHDLNRKADAAMYFAKRSGKDQVAVYAAGMSLG